MPGAVPILKGPDSKGKPEPVPIEGSFSFLCLHAAVALTPLLPNAHSLLLTSGTLSPVAPLVAELGLGARVKPQPTSPFSKAGPSTQSAATTDSTPVAPLVAESGLGARVKHQATSSFPTAGPPTQTPATTDSTCGVKVDLGQIDAGPRDSGSNSGQDGISLAVKAEPELSAGKRSGGASVVLAGAGQQPDQPKQQPSGVKAGFGQLSAHQAELQGLPTNTGTVHQPSGTQHGMQQPDLSQPVKHESAPQHTVLGQSFQDRPSGHQSQAHQSSLLQSTSKLPPADQQHQKDQASGLQISPEAQKSGIPPQHEHVRSQYASLHEGVELVSAPHHHTLPSRLLPLTISMAPGGDGQLVKLDSAYERRQDTGEVPLQAHGRWHVKESMFHPMPACVACLCAGGLLAVGCF